MGEVARARQPRRDARARGARDEHSGDHRGDEEHRPSKLELLAMLVTRRMDQITEAATEAARAPGDHWSALTEMLTTLVSRQAADDVLGEARMTVADHPDVTAASARATDAVDRLLAAAREEGRLRADATSLDVRLLFAATRAAKRVEPERWPRMLELMIDALARGSS